MGQELNGRLLVAAPPLVDPNFDRTVILVLDSDDDGSLGVVLNRPSPVGVDGVLPGWEVLAGPPPVLFLGGPVATQGAVCVGQRRAGEPPGATMRALPGPLRLGLVDLEADPDDVPVERIRVFAGHAGWSPGQLEAEQEAGAWIVVDALPGDLWSTSPKGLWADVLRRQPPPLRLLATYPADPALN